MRTAALTLLLLGAGSLACGGQGPDAVIHRVPSPAVAGSGEPNLFAAGDTAWMSWLEPAGGGHALRFAAWDGSGWSPPRTVARGENWIVNWADFPSIVRLPDGRLAAHWLVRTGEETYAYEIRIATSEDGGRTWSEPVVPHRDGTPTEHGFVSLFPAPAGGGLGVAWLDGRNFADAAAGGHDAEGEPAGGGPEMTLRGAVVGPEGLLGDEVVLDDRACDCCQTGAAVTSRGPVVVYRDRSPDEVRDIAITRLVHGRWTAPRVVHEDGWVIPACPVNGPAVDAAGERVAVAWFTAAADTARVLLAFSDDAGASFGDPIRIDLGAPAGRVDVALLADGAALVTWIERERGAASIRIRRADGRGEPGPALAVAGTSEERASGFPQMALAGEQVLFAWTRPGEPGRVETAAMPLSAF